MADISHYYEDVIIDLMRNVAYTEVTAYVALFTADTGLEADNPDSECTGTGYTRELAGLTAGANGVSANAGIIQFPVAGAADWGTITHFALVDHETNSNWGVDVHVLMWDALTVQKVVGDGDSVKFPIGDLDVNIT